MTTASGIPQEIAESTEPAELAFPSGQGWEVVALTEQKWPAGHVYVAVDNIDGLVAAVEFIEPNPADPSAWLEWSHRDEQDRDVYLISVEKLVLI